MNENDKLKDLQQEYTKRCMELGELEAQYEIGRAKLLAEILNLNNKATAIVAEQKADNQ